MSITKYGTVTITEDQIKIENFHFKFNTWEESNDLAIEWAIKRCQEELRGEPLKQS